MMSSTMSGSNCDHCSFNVLPARENNLFDDVLVAGTLLKRFQIQPVNIPRLYLEHSAVCTAQCVLCGENSNLLFLKNYLYQTSKF